MAKAILGAIFALFFASCAGVGVTSGPSTSVIYEADLFGSVDGIPFQGVFVGQSQPSHTFVIQSKTDVNVMTIQSCHRYLHFEDVIKTGWFRANRGFQTSFDAAPEIETTGYCVIRLAAYSKQVGAGEAYGIGIFKNEKFDLPAINICNGAEGQTSGSSVCQTMAGLVERLKFPGQVVTARPLPDGSGLIPQMCKGKLIDATTFEYEMPQGECIIAFGEVAKPHRHYIHLARGFTKTQYRGN